MQQVSQRIFYDIYGKPVLSKTEIMARAWQRQAQSKP